MLPTLLGLSVITATIALLFARREYRERGRLGFLSLLLLCAMLFMPNLMLEYATTYSMPGSLLEYVGVAVGVAGLVLCFSSILVFRSVTKVLCLNVGSLTANGPYRWSRNPQYLGWLLFLVGFALTDWSTWCFVALVVVAACLHLLVLVEEEHLRRVFGERYIAFCREVPRYVGWWPGHRQ